MKRLIVVLSLILMSSAHAGDIVEEIRKHCAAEWEGNYEMQEYCISNQISAANNVSQIYNTYDKTSEQRKIIDRCASEWQSQTAGYNWEMVEYCSNNQLEAYQRLNQ
jgi:hypothetical protein